jgi:glycosyltransferase involved in cell wall biosynthesis
LELKRFSILHFTNTLVRAGVEEHILTLLRGLDRKHFCLHLACTMPVAEKLQADLPADVELIPLPLETFNLELLAWRLVPILRKRHIDILHSHMFQSSRVASLVGWFCRVPVIVETPHLRELWRTGWPKGSFFVDRLVGRFVDYYVAVSEANGRYLIGEKRLPARKVSVICNGTDFRRFDVTRSTRAELRRSLGIGDNDPVLAVLARLEPQKGHHIILEALPVIRRECPQVRLVCVGEGALRNQLEMQVHSLGLEECVRFVGYQSNPAEWLALADVTVLPSYFEGLPIAAIESLAAGKPIVATAVDGTPEVVVDGKTGLTVPPGNPQALAAAVCRLLQEPELRQALGSAGRQWVVEHFSLEQQVRETQALYLNALRRQRRRADVATRAASAISLLSPLRG